MVGWVRSFGCSILVLLFLFSLALPLGASSNGLPSPDDVDLKITWSSLGVSLSWNAIDQSYFSTGGELRIQRYGSFIEYPGYDLAIIDLSSNDTGYLDRNVTGGHFYEYRLCIWNGDFYAAIAMNTGFVFGGGLPSEPIDLKTTLYDASVTIQWKFDKLDVGGGEFQRFEIYRSSHDADPSLIHNVIYSETSWNNWYEGRFAYSDDDVTIGEDYSYSIKAVNTLGTSRISTEVTARPGFAPLNISISPKEAGVSNSVNASISWDAPLDDEGILCYRVCPYGYSYVEVDNGTFNCSSVDFGFTPVRVASVYEDGRIVYGGEVFIDRPLGPCIGFSWIDLLILIGPVVLVLTIIILIVHLARRKKRNKM